ncbi:MAG: DMT family transporter [Proteocatella sp.]
MNNIISAASGVIIALMLLFNGNLSRYYGNYAASVIIHSVGLITILILVILKKYKFKNCLAVPWYFYSAGAIGVITVLFNNISFSKLGVSLTLAVSLLGQSVASILIDHYGLFGLNKVKFEKQKVTGLVLIVAGIALMAMY